LSCKKAQNLGGVASARAFPHLSPFYYRPHRFQSGSREINFGSSQLGVSSHTRLCDSGFRAGRRLDYMDFVLSHIRCSDSYI